MRKVSKGTLVSSARDAISVNRAGPFLSLFYATTGMKRKTEPSCFVVLEKDLITVPFRLFFL